MDEVSFVVCDLETTGLDETKDVILEVAFAVTDIEFNVLDSRSWLVTSPSWMTILEESSEFVRDMHQKSGLTNELFELPASDVWAGPYGIVTVEAEVKNWLNNHGVNGNYPLTGSTVSFDRNFLKKHMPHVEKCFTYRNIDVSSIKELCRILNPNVFAAYTKMTEHNIKTHRGIADIMATLEELEFYVNEFLLVDFDLIVKGQDVINLP